MARLKRYKRRCGFLIYGFCLMSNHIHLIGEPKELKKLAKFMQCLTRSYTAYFNKRCKKIGHLWQDRFKSKVIVKDNYLIHRIHYIELNPVRANMVKATSEYQWSSYRERVLSQGKDGKLLDELHIYPKRDTFYLGLGTLSRWGWKASYVFFILGGDTSSGICLVTKA